MIKKTKNQYVRGRLCHRIFTNSLAVIKVKCPLNNDRRKTKKIHTQWHHVKQYVNRQEILRKILELVTDFTQCSSPQHLDRFKRPKGITWYCKGPWCISSQVGNVSVSSKFYSPIFNSPGRPSIWHNVICHVFLPLFVCYFI